LLPLVFLEASTSLVMDCFLLFYISQMKDRSYCYCSQAKTRILVIHKIMQHHDISIDLLGE
jgi:hypothetical protein